MNFDLLEFQNKVVSEYGSIKKLLDISYGLSSSLEIKFAFGGEGRLSKGLDHLLTNCSSSFSKKLEKWAAASLMNKDDIKEYSETSIATISRPEVKELLCPLFRKLDGSKLLNEEELVEVVKIVTRQLTTEENRRKFSIKPDAFLFAFMVYEILRIGTANYCVEK